MDWRNFPWLPFWILGSGLVLGILARLEHARYGRVTEADRRRDTRGTPTAPLPTA